MMAIGMMISHVSLILKFRLTTFTWRRLFLLCVGKSC